MLATLAGGLGLFLLGMTMMTDGLRLAAGPALERILAGATRTRWHGLGSGVLVTALVQSSSAVTVATIGFINAGLLTLGGALWVLFGANVGTTMTGWIVALLGLKFKVETLAMPLVGLGVALSLSGSQQRRGAIGTAMAGFGLLFMGIALLQQAMGGLADQVSLPDGTGIGAVLLQMMVGVGLTVLMQSSSASLTVALTAAQGGLLSPEGAAGVVIGANVGTTVTALLAAIGATPSAKRAALAHVAFNIVTAVVALALLPWLLHGIRVLGGWLALPPDAATQLALFHTVFNVLGVVLMWPLASHLTRWLQQHVAVGADADHKPHHIDHTLLGVPSLAVEALGLEVQRLGGLACDALAAAARGEDGTALARRAALFHALDAEVGRFAQSLNRASMSAPTSQTLARWLRVRGHDRHVLDTAVAAAAVAWPGGEGAAEVERHLAQATDVLLNSLRPTPVTGSGDQSVTRLAQESLQAFVQAHDHFKAHGLAQAAAGHWTVPQLDAWLHKATLLKEAALAAMRAAHWRETPLPES